MFKIGFIGELQKQLIIESMDEAVKLGHKVCSSEHIVIAISRKDTLVKEIFQKFGVDTEFLINEVIKEKGRGFVEKEEVEVDDEFVTIIFEKACLYAKMLMGTKDQGAEVDYEKYVKYEHVIMAILSRKSIIKDILNDKGLYQDNFIDIVMFYNRNNSVKVDDKKTEVKNDSVSETMKVISENLQYMGNIAEKQEKEEEFLKGYAKNLTRLACQGKLKKSSQRNQEIDRIVHVLARKEKNTPVITGEAGVGKTAIVYALAYKLVNGELPKEFEGVELYELDMSMVFSGIKYKGDLEEKIKKIITKCEERKNIILFIDNFQSISIMGNQDSMTEAANMFKKFLSESDVRVIGATTLQNYKKYIEKDETLKRRIQSIYIKEPNEKDAILMIQTIKDEYEKYHDVIITDKAIQSAVSLTKRYINDKFLPDKAIDIIDEASASVKLSRKEEFYIVEDILKKLINKEEDEKIKKEEFLENLKKQLDESEIDSKLYENMNMLDIVKNHEQKKYVESSDIEKIISRTTGIPIEKITKKESQKILEMKDKMSKEIIGQDEAIIKLTETIQRSRTGLKDPNRPIGSFIFLGPTGVGKTHTAKMLAKELFDDENSLIRVDMSEYMEKHSVSKMIGSPPGYVGYSEGGQLTEKVKNKPYSILLFDEIEKAHPDIFDILLQVLDEGHLTDSQGRKVDFKNAIIIMTSNVGANEIKNQNDMGFTNRSSDTVDDISHEQIKDKYMHYLKKSLKTEFLNRIDEIIVFRQLSKEDIFEITKLLIKEIENRLKDKSVKIEIDHDALEIITKDGFDKEYGARHLKRIIQTKIENEMAIKILNEEIREKSLIKISGKSGKLEFIIEN